MTFSLFMLHWFIMQMSDWLLYLILAEIYNCLAPGNDIYGHRFVNEKYSKRNIIEIRDKMACMHGSVLKSLSYRVSKVKLMNNNSYTINIWQVITVWLKGIEDKLYAYNAYICWYYRQANKLKQLVRVRNKYICVWLTRDYNYPVH